MQSAKKRAAPKTFTFADNGVIPNNSLPFILHRGAIDLIGSPDPETLVENTFIANGWAGLWRNKGVYPYVHYHSMIHEVMGVARGSTKVRFGGEKGCELDLVAGDVVILPAGTAHQGLWQSIDLVVIGAYPPSGKYNLCRGSKADHAKAIVAIPKVPMPVSDPVFGPKGPLVALWRA